LKPEFLGMSFIRTVGALALGLTLLAGCTNIKSLFGVPEKKVAVSPKPDPSQFSGWMKNYSNLSEHRTPSGGTSLRWVNPALNRGKYKALIIDDIWYHPKPQTGEHVKTAVLRDIPAYLTEQLRQQLGKELTIVKQPGPGVLRLRVAVTGVKTLNRKEQKDSTNPVMLVFPDGSMSSTAKGGVQTVVFMEAQLVDSQTNNVMAKSVRRGISKSLSGKHAQLTLADVKPTLDNWVEDASVFFQKNVN
jgi:hypothetical protein